MHLPVFPSGCHLRMSQPPKGDSNSACLTPTRHHKGKFYSSCPFGLQQWEQWVMSLQVYLQNMCLLLGSRNRAKHINNVNSIKGSAQDQIKKFSFYRKEWVRGKRGHKCYSHSDPLMETWEWLSLNTGISDSFTFLFTYCLTILEWICIYWMYYYY